MLHFGHLDGRPDTAWTLCVGADRVLSLSAEGTPLIQTGRYVGVMQPALMLSLRKQVERLRAEDKSLPNCQDQFEFSVSEGSLYRSACAAGIEKSDLYELYAATLTAIKETSWKPVPDTVH